MKTQTAPETQGPAYADVVIEPLNQDDLDTMLDVLARGMRDNDSHVAVFGLDQVERERLLRKLFGSLAGNPEILRNARVARLTDGTIVGAYSGFAPGTCQPKPLERLRMLPAVLRLGFGNARRTMTWLGAWSKHDPKTRHWHFGPVAVDAHLQGQGIGSAMMRDFCAQMDQAGEEAYLETDKAINVPFYQRFGFEVIDQETVMDFTTWYMIRKPRPSA